MAYETNPFSDSQQDLANQSAEIRVGQKVRELRSQRGWSLRILAERSALNINTLSLIENGKSSPSVSTLQQLAQALEIPIARFFETKTVSLPVVFTPHDQRPQNKVGSTAIQNLGKDLAGNAVQPLVVSLPPGTGSGDRMIVHTGHEFVYCLSGSVHYQIDSVDYTLQPHDSLVFEAHLPHCWNNNADEPAQVLLILYPSEARDEPGGRHFSSLSTQKEHHMKVAVITNDGKTISQHFGRAPYYLVATIEDGIVVNRELREKVGHNQFSGDHHSHEGHGEHHGADAGAHHKHGQMAEAIADCKIVICGGMGTGAYESMRRFNIQPIVTDLREVDAALQAVIDGTLVDHTELLH